MNDNCVFCKIIKNELPREIEAETENVIAFKSNKPVAETHILVMPKKHIETFLNLTSEDKNLFMEMAIVSQKLVKDRNIAQGYKLLFNGGKYQSVPHLHWHLLGGDFEDTKDILSKT